MSRRGVLILGTASHDVQPHPEVVPGHTDSMGLFGRFAERLR